MAAPVKRGVLGVLDAASELKTISMNLPIYMCIYIHTHTHTHTHTQTHTHTHTHTYIYGKRGVLDAASELKTISINVQKREELWLRNVLALCC
jgi:hypothetical protein